MTRRARWTLIVGLAVTAWSAPPALADTVLSTEPSSPKLSAEAGVAAWSTYDATSGAWFLVVRRGGVLERAAVAPRAYPFDVDLGRDADDRLVAAYSRCERDPDIAPTLGRGCDLFVYDIETRAERRLAGPSSDGASEYMPSLDDGYVAFGRVHERRSGAAGVQTSIYVRRLDRGPARLVPGGTRNADNRTGLTGMDLDGRRLAFSWRTAGPAGLDIPYGAAELRVDDLSRGTQTLVVRLPGSSLDYGGVTTPQLSGRVITYGLIWVSEGGTSIGDLATYDVVRGTRTAQRFPDRIAGVAVTGADTYYVRCNPETVTIPGCDVAVRGTAGGADADVLLDRAARATTASWVRRWTAFSAWDGDAYRLVLRSDQGTVLRPGVRGRSVPFDVDLGRDDRARLIAVYSRCRTEPRRDPADRLPLRATGRGCDLYRYDVGRRRETRIAGPAGASEFLPAIDGSHIAFARRIGQGPTNIYRDDRRLAGGSGRFGPIALDLRGRRVAFVWDRRLGDGRRRSQVRLATTSGSDRTLASVTSRDGSRRLRSPGFDRNTLSWVGHRVPGLGRAAAIRQPLPRGTRRVYVLPETATVFLPWTSFVGAPRQHLGVYGARDGAGWTLRSALMLPELLR